MPGTEKTIIIIIIIIVIIIVISLLVFLPHSEILQSDLYIETMALMINENLTKTVLYLKPSEAPPIQSPKCPVSSSLIHHANSVKEYT